MANNIMSTIIVLFYLEAIMNELIIKDNMKVEDMIYTIRDNR